MLYIEVAGQDWLNFGVSLQTIAADAADLDLLQTQRI
jgi:hypothetical protein